MLIHSKTLAVRRPGLDQFIADMNTYPFLNLKMTEFKIVEAFDPANIDPVLQNKVVDFSRIEDPVIGETFNSRLSKLQIPQISNCLKHFAAIDYVARNGGINGAEDDIYMVLEDDIKYGESVFADMDKLVMALPDAYDVLSLGLPSKVDPTSPLSFIRTDGVFKILPYCNAYIIHPLAAKRFQRAYLPIKFGNNIHMSYVASITSSTGIYHSSPPLFLDGSKCGSFTSSLNPNNLLIFNNDYNLLRAAVTKEGDVASHDVDRLLQLASNSPVAAHPDFMYLKAMLFIKLLRFQEALETCERAYKLYIADGCMMSQESEFLGTYITLFSKLQ